MASVDIRTCLTATRHGDEVAKEKLSSTIYEELRGLAGAYMARFPGVQRVTLQPTVIVHEALMKLLGNSALDDTSRTHFLAVAAVAMRCVLIDHARQRGTQKRGEGAAHVTIDTGDAVVQDGFVGLIELDELLEKLRGLSERAERVVQMRVFGGMTVAEVASALGVSERTVKGDWRMARAWLIAELSDMAQA